MIINRCFRSILVFLFIFNCSNKRDTDEIKLSQNKEFYFIDKIKLRKDIILEDELPHYNFLGSLPLGINCAKFYKYNNNEIFITRSDFSSRNDFDIISMYNEEIVSMSERCKFKIDSLKLDINNDIYIYSETSKNLNWNSIIIGKKQNESFIRVSISSHPLHKKERNVIEKEVVDSIYYSLLKMK